jgi:hypothetical protein
MNTQTSNVTNPDDESSGRTRGSAIDRWANEGGAPPGGTAEVIPHDLNHLLGAEQTSIMQAQAAALGDARTRHEDDAHGLRATINETPYPSRAPHDFHSRPITGGDAAYRDDELETLKVRVAEMEAELVTALSEDRMGIVTHARLVQTHGQPMPYKVVFENRHGGRAECPVQTVREGEELMRDKSPAQPQRTSLRDWSPGPGS